MNSQIVPVFLGADLNCYNFARAFHEAYGVKSWAFGRYEISATKYSRIINFKTVPDMDCEETMLRELHATLKKGTADARDPVMNVGGFKMASTPSGLP